MFRRNAQSASQAVRASSLPTTNAQQERTPYNEKEGHISNKAHTRIRVTVRLLRRPIFACALLVTLASAIAVVILFRIFQKEYFVPPFYSKYIYPTRGVSPPTSIFNFPSPEERIRYYMSDWINPQTATRIPMADLCSTIAYWKPSLPPRDIPYRFDRYNLAKYRNKPWSLPWRYYVGEAIHVLRHHTSETECPRILAKFGDAYEHSPYLQTKFPIWMKSRLAGPTYKERFPEKNHSNPDLHPPLLGLMHIHRHYRHFELVDRVWSLIPWHTKKDSLIWRGTTSGKRPEVVRKYFHYNHTDVDVAFSSTLKDKWFDQYKPYVRNEVSVEQLLGYKYQLVLEGWCYSTSLKWLLYSNSVVFMAPPTKASWAMEDMLVPGVHYIELKPDHSDLLEKVEWARSHDDEVYQIVLQSRDFMEKLVTSEQAKQETQLILQEMRRIYQQNFGKLLAECSND